LDCDLIVVLLKVRSFEAATGSQFIGNYAGLPLLFVSPSGLLDFWKQVYPGVVILLEEAFFFLYLRLEAGPE
jgi:hypothetical protein